MKIYQLIEILKQRDQNDTVLIPSGDDTLTDCFLLRTLKTDVVSGPRHVALIPLEGRLRNVWQEGSMAYGKEEAKP